MSYTRPEPGAVNFWWDGATYTRPASNDVDLSWQAVGLISIVAVPIACGFPQVVANADPIGFVSAPSVLMQPQVVASVGAAGHVQVPAPLFSPEIYAQTGWGAISVPIACGAPAVFGASSFDGLIPSTARLRYFMEIVTPSGAVRVPISSWQSSLRTDAQSYVQAVVPGCEPYLQTLEDGTEFVIYREATWTGGQVLQEMCRAPLDTVRTDRGPINYTASIQGYGPAFPQVESEAGAFTRALSGVRTVSSTEGSTTIRAAIDWTLRPGMVATYLAVAFPVSYINQYVTQGDEYMDVGGDV